MLTECMRWRMLKRKLNDLASGFIFPGGIHLYCLLLGEQTCSRCEHSDLLPVFSVFQTEKYLKLSSQDCKLSNIHNNFTYMYAVLCSVAQSRPTLYNPMDSSPPGSSVHGDPPGKNTGVGCHALLWGIFPTQGSNPGLPHFRWILYHLSHQGSPLVL